MNLISRILIIVFLFLLTSPAKSEQAAAPKPKNLIVLVGDGMGPQQIGLAALYAKEAPKGSKSLAIERFIDKGETGIVLTNPDKGLVVDSACSMTQFSTGKRSGSQMVGLDSDGNPAETMLEKAKALGKSVGLVTDTRLTHATPASFASHQPTRYRENKIAEDLLLKKVDVLFGGGARHFLPASVNKKGSAIRKNYKKLTGFKGKFKSKRKDENDLVTIAEEYGYQVNFNKKAFSSAKTLPQLGLFAISGLQDAITTKKLSEAGSLNIPTLREMTAKALDLLSTNEKGFFLMVEAGQIDWAGHENDAGRLLNEMLRLDSVVDLVLDWAKDRNDTLVVLTADHETGSFGFSYSGYQLPKGKELSGTAFKDSIFKPSYNFIDPSNLDRLFNQQKTLVEVWEDFDDLSYSKRRPKALAKMVTDATGFFFSRDSAKKVLEEHYNEFYDSEHKQLSEKTVPHIHDFAAFYPYIGNNRAVLIARGLAKEQGVVWGTGTHTSTPVLITAIGPSSATKNFKGLMHMSEAGQLVMDAAGLSNPGE